MGKMGQAVQDVNKVFVSVFSFFFHVECAFEAPEKDPPTSAVYRLSLQTLK